MVPKKNRFLFNAYHIFFSLLFVTVVEVSLLFALVLLHEFGFLNFKIITPGMIPNSSVSLLVLFVAVLTADILLLFGVVASIAFPKHRIWPPPQEGTSWQSRISEVFSAIGFIGSPLLGIFDFESLGNACWIRFLVGGLAILIGGSIAIWGKETLIEHQSLHLKLGLKEKLVTRGPYSYSRHPQYLGFIIMFIGITLSTYSTMALATASFVTFVFMIAPFSEEILLKQQFGKSYEEYCCRVPRLLGLRSFKTRKNSSC